MRAFGAVLFVVASAAAYSADAPVEIQQTQITPSDADSAKSGLGVVYGTRPCGGLGQFVQWRIEGCDTTDSPCQFPADGELRRSELDFIPSEDIEQLGCRLILSVDGKQPKVVYDKPILNSTVTGGEQHTKKSAGGVSKELKGKNVTAQYILYRADEQKEIEICTEADFEIV